MSNIAVALRYAKSLLDLAKEQNILDVVLDDMELFRNTAKVNAELRLVLSNPIVSNKAKQNVLSSLFASKVNKLTMAFFNLSISKGRSGYLYEISKQFVNLYLEQKGIVEAEFVSAEPISDIVKKELKKDLEEQLKLKVNITFSEKKDLIGGFVLTIGDRRIDTSILRRIKDLRKSMIA